MTLNFEKIDQIFKSYGLESHTIKDGKCTEYEFKDRFVHTKKRNVATRVKSLLKGGVAGYIYVDHLKEYTNHPKKTKEGHIYIGNMTEQELREITQKVIKEYK